jgi:hypothetical protein
MKRLFVPDLALFMALLTLVYCIFFCNAPRSFFRDSSTGQQIVMGEKILSDRHVPRTETSIAWGWASDCAMGFADSHAGLPAVVWLFAVSIAIVTWLWFQLNWECGGNFFFALILTVPMLATTQLQWTASPHIFGWLLLLTALLYFEKAPTQFRIRNAFLLASAGALWANVDTSFPLLPVIALIYGVSHLARPFIWQTESAIDLRKGRWFLLASLFSGLATLLNPYGWNLHVHLADSIGPAFQYHLAAGPWIALGIAAAGGTLALCEKKLAHFILALVFVGGAIRFPQMLPLMALVMLPLANGAITHALHRAKDLRVGLRRALNVYLAYSDRWRLLDARFSGIALAPFAAVLLWLFLQIPSIASYTGFPPDEFPVYGANEVAQLSPNIRLLSTRKYSDYLIYRFRGKLKVFTADSSRQDPERFRFSHALLPNDDPLVPALQRMGWKVLFRDDLSTLLVNNEVKVSS